MDYEKAYKNLTESRVGLSRDCYIEKHHILPKSMGGSDKKENIVHLTAKEHFIAHRLLAKIHGGKMWAALAYMSRSKTKSAQGLKVTARVYAIIKEKDSEWRSEKYSGDGNPFKGKTFTKEQREKLLGPRPSIAGKNHPKYGKKYPGLGDVISGVKKHKAKPISDSFMQKKIESLVFIDTKTLRVMREFYLRSESMKRAMADIDITGSNNPNYGNGQAISGEKNPMWGKKQKDETKAKIGEKAKRTLQCPHCGKVGNIANMHRWHFDNCTRRSQNTFSFAASA